MIEFYKKIIDSIDIESKILPTDKGIAFWLKFIYLKHKNDNAAKVLNKDRAIVYSECILRWQDFIFEYCNTMRLFTLPMAHLLLDEDGFSTIGFTPDCSHLARFDTRLPDAPGVYIVSTAEDDLDESPTNQNKFFACFPSIPLYVGITSSSMRSRWGKHHIKQKLQNLFYPYKYQVSVDFWWNNDYIEFKNLLEIEKKLIYLLRPELNDTFPSELDNCIFNDIELKSFWDFELARAGMIWDPTNKDCATEWAIERRRVEEKHGIPFGVPRNPIIP